MPKTHSEYWTGRSALTLAFIATEACRIYSSQSSLEPSLIDFSNMQTFCVISSWFFFFWWRGGEGRGNDGCWPHGFARICTDLQLNWDESTHFDYLKGLSHCLCWVGSGWIHGDAITLFIGVGIVFHIFRVLGGTWIIVLIAWWKCWNIPSCWHFFASNSRLGRMTCCNSRRSNDTNSWKLFPPSSSSLLLLLVFFSSKSRVPFITQRWQSQIVA